MGGAQGSEEGEAWSCLATGRMTLKPAPDAGRRQLADTGDCMALAARSPGGSSAAPGKPWSCRRVAPGPASGAEVEGQAALVALPGGYEDSIGQRRVDMPTSADPGGASPRARCTSTWASGDPRTWQLSKSPARPAVLQGRSRCAGSRWRPKPMPYPVSGDHVRADRDATIHRPPARPSAAVPSTETDHPRRRFWKSSVNSRDPAPAPCGCAA